MNDSDTLLVVLQNLQRLVVDLLRSSCTGSAAAQGRMRMNELGYLSLPCAASDLALQKWCVGWVR